MTAHLWTRAADAMREDDDPRWHAVADWLRAEALCQAEMEPFLDLMNVAIEQKSGVKGYLRLKRRPDGGVMFNADTNEGATAVALAYLGDTDTLTTPTRDQEAADVTSPPPPAADCLPDRPREKETSE